MANTATKRRLIGLSIVLSLVASACGGDTPAAVQDALEIATPNLAYVDDSESSCVAGSVFDQVGFDQLALEGHTSETISSNPESAIAKIVEDHDSPELRAALIGCLEVDERFREALFDELLTDDLECDAPFGIELGIVGDFIDATLDSETSKITIEDTTEMRDLFRPCVSNNDFASIFDIANPTDLAAAIDANFDTKLRPDGTPCAGRPIVDTVGFEELEGFGITTDEASVDLRILELDDDTQASLLQEIRDCSDFVSAIDANYAIAEPGFAECVVQTLETDDDWLDANVNHAVGLTRSSRSMTRAEDKALDSCVLERIEEVFGPADTSILLPAFTFAEGVYLGAQTEDYTRYGPSEHDYRCMTYGLFETHGQEGVYEYAEQMGIHDETTDAFWTAYDAIWGVMGEMQRRCLGDWLTVSGDVTRAGFSEETLDCMRDEIDDVEKLADVLTLPVAELTDSEYDAYSVEWESRIFDWNEALADCYTEADEDTFEDFTAWQEGLDVLPDATTNDDFVST